MVKKYLGQVEGLEGQKGTQPGGDNCGQGVLPQVQVHQVSEKDYILYYIIIDIHIIRSNFLGSGAKGLQDCYESPEM